MIFLDFFYIFYLLHAFGRTNKFLISYLKKHSFQVQTNLHYKHKILFSRNVRGRIFYLCRLDIIYIIRIYGDMYTKQQHNSL